MRRLHVDEMLAELSVTELREWQAWFRLEPSGGRADDARHGELCSLIHNLWSSGKRAMPADYMHKPPVLRVAATVPRQTPEQMDAAFGG